jgi:protein-tyrosine phosphatase
MTVRLCFVCLGNICRSPTAEAVMAALVAEAGLADQIEVDSAGTGAWHVGEPPDERATAEAGRRGIRMISRARRFETVDFEQFDLILAMDDTNRDDLHQQARSQDDQRKVMLLRSFDPDADHGAVVPDPYYGGESGFADGFDLVDAACRGLLDHITERHEL